MRHGFVAISFVILFASFAPAQTTPTTRLIPFSGTALDATDTPVRSGATVTFELYEEVEGGVPLWRETQDVQTDDRGRYLVYLGHTVPLPQVAFTEERARWLAVTIGGRTLPRVMLVAVPYALRAADAETLGGHSASSYVRRPEDGRLEASAGVVVSQPAVEGSGVAGQIAKFTSATSVGASVISESASNRVGFGLTDPTGGGVVDSVFTIRNFDNNTGFGILNQNQQRRFAINTLFSGGWALYDGGSGTWNQGLSQVNGNIGIGTTVPDSKLTIRNPDNAAAINVLSLAGQRRFALNTRSNGSWTLYDGVNGTWNPGITQHFGNVNIGFENTLQSGRLNVENDVNHGSVGVYTRSTSGPALIASTPVGGGPAIVADGGARISGFGRALDVRTDGPGNTAIWTEAPNGALAAVFNGPVSMNSESGTALGVIGGISASSFNNNTALQVFNGTGTAVQIDAPAGSTLLLGRRDGNNVFRINAAGQAFAAGYTTGGADFAEELDPSDDPDRYEPGDVLTIGPGRDRTVVVSHLPYATTVLGVYSTQPGITASPYPMDDPRREGKLPVAMIGIVPCKVSTENGPIERGDLLVSSATPGHAMKATDRARMTGAIVGKALQSLESGAGKILIAVTLQ